MGKHIEIPIIDQNLNEVGQQWVEPSDLFKVEGYVDESGTVWTPPTAMAYFVLAKDYERLRQRTRRLEAEIEELKAKTKRPKDVKVNFDHGDNQTPPRIIPVPVRCPRCGYLSS